MMGADQTTSAFLSPPSLPPRRLAETETVKLGKVEGLFMCDCNALVVLFDCSAAWASSGGAAGAAQFSHALDAVAVAMRAFLTLRPTNRVAVLGFTARGATLVSSEPLEDVRRATASTTVLAAVEGLRKLSLEQVPRGLTHSRVCKC